MHIPYVSIIIVFVLLHTNSRTPTIHTHTLMGSITPAIVRSYAMTITVSFNSKFMYRVYPHACMSDYMCTCVYTWDISLACTHTPTGSIIPAVVRGYDCLMYLNSKCMTLYYVYVHVELCTWILSLPYTHTHTRILGSITDCCQELWRIVHVSILLWSDSVCIHDITIFELLSHTCMHTHTQCKCHVHTKK